MKKRFITLVSMILTLSIVFGALGITAFAATVNNSVDIDFSTHVHGANCSENMDMLLIPKYQTINLAAACRHLPKKVCRSSTSGLFTQVTSYYHSYICRNCGFTITPEYLAGQYVFYSHAPLSSHWSMVHETHAY